MFRVSLQVTATSLCRRYVFSTCYDILFRLQMLDWMNAVFCRHGLNELKVVISSNSYG